MPGRQRMFLLRSLLTPRRCRDAPEEWVSMEVDNEKPGVISTSTPAAFGGWINPNLVCGVAEMFVCSLGTAAARGCLRWYVLPTRADATPGSLP